jgi:uncharacterized membrane protein YtjA (UPF0391 family)
MAVAKPREGDGGGAGDVPVHTRRVRKLAHLACPVARALLFRSLHQEGVAMLHWALMFFVIAVIAAVLGLRGVAGLSAEIGYVFAVVAVIFLAVSVLAGRMPPVEP